ncbi:feruloyl CoA ortho-hydroxylase 1-like protein, partial [Tanacetum coccineum]
MNLLLILHMRLGAEVGAESGRFRYRKSSSKRGERLCRFIAKLDLKSSCGCILSSHDGAWQDDTGSKEDSEDVDDEGIGCSPIIGMGNFSYIQPPQERFDSINEEPNQDSIPIVDHGVAIHVLDDVKDATRKFFSLPAEEKLKYSKEKSVTNNIRFGTNFTPEAEKLSSGKIISASFLSQMMRLKPSELL